VKVQRLLGDRIGKDVLMLSISLDPENDTPPVLKKYAKNYGSKPGWLYLTGKFEDIEELRHRMGVYDPDPIIDADKTQHGNLLTFGDDRNDKWAAVPALLHPVHIVEAVFRLTYKAKTPPVKTAQVSLIAPDAK